MLKDIFFYLLLAGGVVCLAWIVVEIIFPKVYGIKRKNNLKNSNKAYNNNISQGIVNNPQPNESITTTPVVSSTDASTVGASETNAPKQRETGNIEMDEAEEFVFDPLLLIMQLKEKDETDEAGERKIDLLESIAIHAKNAGDQHVIRNANSNKPNESASEHSSAPTVTSTSNKSVVEPISNSRSETEVGYESSSSHTSKVTANTHYNSEPSHSSHALSTSSDSHSNDYSSSSNDTSTTSSSDF